MPSESGRIYEYLRARTETIFFRVEDLRERISGVGRSSVIKAVLDANRLAESGLELTHLTFRVGAAYWRKPWNV